ncbi:hypothetical protein [Streptomyces sp900116325]|uniref:hypothetical protein n=1 Tax=Streptomyces sp. 900116325 TaxID=3154295 RepID=UPI0033EAB2D5
MNRVDVHDMGVLHGVSAGRLSRDLVGHRFNAPEGQGKWLLARADGLTVLLRFGVTGNWFSGQRLTRPIRTTAWCSPRTVDIAKAVPCGMTLATRRVVQAFADAGSAEIALVQIGRAHQHLFLRRPRRSCCRPCANSGPTGGTPNPATGSAGRWGVKH